METQALVHVFIFLAAACVVVPLVSRFKLGSVLGYLLAGIVIGPFGLGFINNTEEVMHFAEFGVVMMLFVIGLELEPATLWRLKRSIIGLGGLQVTLSTAALTGIGVLLGYAWQPSLAVAMALSLSSTALVLQMLNEKNLMQTSIGESSFAVLLFQDIAVIPILVLMPLLAVGGAGVAPHGATLLDGLPGWAHAMVVAGVIGAVILAGRYLLPHMFYFIARSRLREVFTANSLAIVVGITLLMQLVGVSPALGAFVAGVVLANSSYKHTLETDLEPFKGLLLGLFFISVGMGMDFDLLREQPGRLVASVAGLVLVKGTILYVLGRAFRVDSIHTLGFALLLSQGGEFAFVLFQFAQQLQVVGTAEAGFYTLVVGISIATTPLLALLYSRYVVPRFMSLLPPRDDYERPAPNGRIILAGYGRFGQIIGRFLMGQGVAVTILEKDPDQVELLRKFGFKGYFGDASRLDLLEAAGAKRADMLVVAVDEADAALAIAQIAKEHFPQLKIFARARNRRHAYELHRIGVDYFKRETFDSALSMAQQIMVALGHDARSMRIKAKRFSKHDEKTLLQSFEFYEREPELISFSRQANGELERILQTDVKEKVQARPAAIKEDRPPKPYDVECEG